MNKKYEKLLLPEYEEIIESLENLWVSHRLLGSSLSKVYITPNEFATSMGPGWNVIIGDVKFNLHFNKTSYNNAVFTFYGNREEKKWESWLSETSLKYEVKTVPQLSKTVIVVEFSNLNGEIKKSLVRLVNINLENNHEKYFT